MSFQPDYEFCKNVCYNWIYGLGVEYLNLEIILEEEIYGWLSILIFASQEFVNWRTKAKATVTS